MSDLARSLNGDLELAPSGGLRLTDESWAESIFQAVHRRITSSTEDFRLMFPPTCAGLRNLPDPYKMNTRDTANYIAMRIRNSIVQDNILPSNLIDLRVFPLSVDTMGIRFGIKGITDLPRMMISMDLASGLCQTAII